MSRNTKIATGVGIVSLVGLIVWAVTRKPAEAAKNLLENSTFEGDPPTGWIPLGAIISRELGGIKIVSQGGHGGVYQDIPDFGRYAGREITLGARVRAVSTNDTPQRIYIDDGVVETWSGDIPKDNAWHWMTVTCTVSSLPTRLRAGFWANRSGLWDADDVLYVDDAILEVS